MTLNQIDPDTFLDFLLKKKINFFTGVPDSLLKHFCSSVQSNKEIIHQSAANEGSALALAIGSYLATNRLPCVYLQNSGLGNLVNPLLSLASKDVYSIPCLLIIGWRGEILENGEQIIDEPQHKHQGKATLPLLKALNIEYKVISSETIAWQEDIDSLINMTIESSKPVALLVRKNTFSENKIIPNDKIYPYPTREEALKTILNLVNPSIPIFSTTGMCSRELYELRQAISSQVSDFLCIGGMGHISNIACGFLLNSKHNKAICLDGDGSVIMHMGSLFRSSQVKGLIHIMFNNSSHDSVGGQPTNAFDIDFEKLTMSLGYKKYFKTTSISDIKDVLSKLPDSGSCFIEIRISKGSRKDLGRPNTTPIMTKTNFMTQWSNNA